MVFAHVIYKKTNLERKTTVKAYNLLKNQYTLLGYVDENDNPVNGPQETGKTTQKKRVVERAVNEPRKQMSAEEIEAKKAELKALNDAAIQKAKDEQAKEAAESGKQLVEQPIAEQAKERKKPGPKPKTNA